MRFLKTVVVVAVLAAAPAFAQQTVNAPNPYGLDPYKPSDAAWLRDFGSALVAQTPLLELSRLDPYKPSDAALVRQIGAIPLCCPNWLWSGSTFGPLTPFMTQGSTAPLSNSGLPAPLVNGVVVMATPPPSAEPPAAAVQSKPTAMSSAIRPATNDGVWLRYADQIWISAGRAVPLDGLELQRVGDYYGAAVYKRARGADDVIYVPAREGMIAPYRLKR